MKYRIEFTEKAYSEFSRLPEKIRKKLSEKIAALMDDPRPVGARKIKGRDDSYRIRQGDYRIVYAIMDDKLLVLVVRAGHRKDVYSNLESLSKSIRKLKE